MEGEAEMNRALGDNFESSSVGGRRSRDESRSVSDDDFSADDLDVVDKPSNKRKKKYNRHTPQQIQELESLFKECPHPDEKQRLEVSKKLNLETRQVKFWFQNRRTHMKSQIERHENTVLRQENYKLRAENKSLRDALRSPMCINCGGVAVIEELSFEEHQLRIENARLRDELERYKFMGRAPSSMGPPMPNSSLDLGVGNNGFRGFNMTPSTLSMYAPNSGVGPSNPMPILSNPTMTMNGGAPTDRSLQRRSMFLERALAAMDEFLKIAQSDDPLWVRNIDGGNEMLNHEEYLRNFAPCIGMKPNGFVSEASRGSGNVIIGSSALVEILMDSTKWKDMFPGIVARTTTTEVISRGMSGTRNGALLLMEAELQVLSPLVPIREVRFLRFCKQHAEGTWAVVDLSIDTIEGSGSTFPVCRRLPSGCLVQDVANGYSKVIWVEHTEYDETGIHQLYRNLISSGHGFGTQRMIATLQRQTECLAIFMTSAASPGDSAISAAGRQSFFKLAKRLTSGFFAGICASSIYTWTKIHTENMDEGIQVMTRQSMDNPGEPVGMVLSVATSVWLPAPPQTIFDYLRNEGRRNEWDVLTTGPVQEMAHIVKGLDQGNYVSLLKASTVSPSHPMLILQDTCIDAAGALVVYAPVDVPSMNHVMNGGDSACVVMLPSGFVIVPDGPDGAGGTLLSVSYQILVSSLPTARLSAESVEIVNSLISGTVQKIKAAVLD